MLYNYWYILILFIHQNSCEQTILRILNEDVFEQKKQDEGIKNGMNISGLAQ